MAFYHHEILYLELENNTPTESVVALQFTCVKNFKILCVNFLKLDDKENFFFFFPKEGVQKKLKNKRKATKYRGHVKLPL